MAKITNLASAVALTGTVAQTGVDNGNKTPFLPNRKIRARVEISADATGAPTIKVQGSDDNSTWVDLATFAGLASNEQMVTAYRYMRANQTVAGGAGTYNAFIEA